MNDRPHHAPQEPAPIALKVLVAGAANEPLERLASALRARSPHDSVAVGAGDHGQLPTHVARHDPDVLVLAEPDAGAPTLEIVERLTHLYPLMSTVVLCEDQSAQFLMQAMRAGVREILPATAAANDVGEAIARIGRKRNAHPDQHGEVLAFLSCKGGGGGATFLATNIAYALAAEEGKRVLLIDLNLQWGDAVFFVSDKRPSLTLADLALSIHRVDPAFLHSAVVHVHPNLSVLAAPEDPVHALDVKPEHIDVLVRIARTHYDFVILDAGRSLDAVTVRALDYADAIFPVLQLSLPFVRDGKRILAAFRALDYPQGKIRVLVNRYEKGGDISLDDLATALGRKAWRTIPNDYDHVVKSINQGVPIVKLAHGSPVARALRELAHDLAVSPTETKGGWLDRVLHRT